MVPQVHLDIDQEAVNAFCRRHRIRRLALFGSVLRDDFSDESDVDVLVEFEPGVRIGLIGFAGLEIELSELFGRTVDLNTAGFINPQFRDEVLADAEQVFPSAA